MITRGPVNWPFLIATASLPLSAYLIVKTAHPTRRGGFLDSSFLAFEFGCLAMFAAYGLVWSIAWLILRKRRLKQVPGAQVVLAVSTIIVAILVMLSFLPLPGQPSLPEF
jgi:hypothetical protein